MKEIEELKGLYLHAEYCGSRVTCDPPPTDTDLDILILTLDMLTLDRFLIDNDWTLGGSRIVDEVNKISPDDRFSSYTKNEVNLIVTTSFVFMNKFKLATEVSKALNLMRKDDRIVLFQAIVYGNAPLW